MVEWPEQPDLFAETERCNEITYLGDERSGSDQVKCDVREIAERSERLDKISMILDFDEVRDIQESASGVTPGGDLLGHRVDCDTHMNDDRIGVRHDRANIGHRSTTAATFERSVALSRATSCRASSSS